MVECYKVVIKACDIFTTDNLGIKDDNTGRGKLYRRVAVHILSKKIDYQWKVISEYLGVSKEIVYRDYLYTLYNSDTPRFKFAYSRVTRYLRKNHKKCSKILL